MDEYIYQSLEKYAEKRAEKRSIELLVNLVAKGLISVEIAATEADLDVDVFQKKMEELENQSSDPEQMLRENVEAQKKIFAEFFSIQMKKIGMSVEDLENRIKKDDEWRNEPEWESMYQEMKKQS